jgi:hypothetical protein
VGQREGSQGSGQWEVLLVFQWYGMLASSHACPAVRCSYKDATNAVLVVKAHMRVPLRCWPDVHVWARWASWRVDRWAFCCGVPDQDTLEVLLRNGGDLIAPLQAELRQVGWFAE